MSTAREILNTYAFWDDMARKKIREQQRLRDRKTSIKVVYSDAPGGEPEDMVDYMAKIEELDQDLKEIRAERDRALYTIMRLAFKMGSVKQVDMIYRRDIHRDGWGRICRDLGVSRTAAVRMHDRAVAAMDELLKSGG